MSAVTFKDGTSYVFPDDTYPIIYADTQCKRFERVKSHRRHPTEIHVDMFGIVRFYYADESMDVEHIASFTDANGSITLFR